MNNFQILDAVRRKYSSLSKSLEQSLLAIDDPEDLELLAQDLEKCPTVHHLAMLVEWLEGRQAGRVEGLRHAVSIVLGYRFDQAAEEIEEAACESSDPAELKALLGRAVNLGRETAVSRN